MADKKISQLTGASTPLAGTEVLPIVQSGSTVKVSIDNVTKGRTVNATTFDTDVAAAAVTLTGTTLSADGTDTNIDISVTPKGTGSVNITKANVDGGTVDGTVIGGSSAAAGTFTATTANSFALSTTQSVVTGGMWYQTSGGKLVFTAPSTGGVKWNNYTNTVEIASLNDAGKFTVADNLVIGTAAKGIDFSANTGNVLDQYKYATHTPTWTGSVTNPAIGNGTLAGNYVLVGKSCTFQFNLQMGNTTTFGSGNYTFSAPIAAAAPATGSVWAFDNGVAYYIGVCKIETSSTDIVIFSNASGQNWGATVPFTWGNTDRLVLTISYIV